MSRSVIDVVFDTIPLEGTISLEELINKSGVKTRQQVYTSLHTLKKENVIRKAGESTGKTGSALYQRLSHSRPRGEERKFIIQKTTRPTSKMQDALIKATNGQPLSTLLSGVKPNTDLQKILKHMHTMQESMTAMQDEVVKIMIKNDQLNEKVKRQKAALEAIGKKISDINN